MKTFEFIIYSLTAILMVLVPVGIVLTVEGLLEISAFSRIQTEHILPLILVSMTTVATLYLANKQGQEKALKIKLGKQYMYQGLYVLDTVVKSSDYVLFTEWHESIKADDIIPTIKVKYPSDKLEVGCVYTALKVHGKLVLQKSSDILALQSQAA